MFIVSGSFEKIVIYCGFFSHSKEKLLSNLV